MPNQADGQAVNRHHQREVIIENHGLTLGV